MEKPLYNPINSPLAYSAKEVVSLAEISIEPLKIKRDLKVLFLTTLFTYVNAHPILRHVKSDDIYKERVFGPLEIINLTTMAVTAIVINKSNDEDAVDMTELLEIQSMVVRRHIIRDSLIAGISDIQYKKALRN